ncbi:NAD(+) diphosphatase [Leisingera aquaemixtae]|uniref:NAD(+) diphosphatase n=1 Tax=Leisingera TaxID=191028 RepID=UPI001C9574B8|nr:MULTISPECIES: NAD(+) diphosphatase [Leisingera]MBY6067693.1 NAD(+) diphosphatase [Leisingera aquaemixtae]MCB4456653.1 NAD(+) diphosphatase [Leisingera sp. McT4-56]
MKRAEQVTFGSGGLERAAHLRSDAAALDAAWASADTRVLLLWRGKPLTRRETEAELPCGLAWTDPTHPLAAARRDEALFLGLGSGGAPCFACDISSWQPDSLDQDALNSFADASEQQHPDLPQGRVFAELRRVMTRLTPLEAELAATAKAMLAWHRSHRFCACCGAPSDMAQAGWQRVCPSCKAPHFPRTDPVVIMLITHGDAVLMGRSPGWPEGMYSLLAGFVEPGETLEAAVRREVLEETGVQVGAVSYLSSQPWAFPMSLMFGCAGEALSREITIDPAEIEDALWVSRQEMMTVFAGEHPVLKPARKGAIAQFLLKNWLADTLD